MHGMLRSPVGSRIWPSSAFDDQGDILSGTSAMAGAALRAAVAAVVVLTPSAHWRQHRRLPACLASCEAQFIRCIELGFSYELAQKVTNVRQMVRAGCVAGCDYTSAMLALSPGGGGSACSAGCEATGA